VNTLKKMIWTEKTRNAGNLRRRVYLGDLGSDVSKWVLNKWGLDGTGFG
jgi:hypothetical protein